MADTSAKQKSKIILIIFLVIVGVAITWYAFHRYRVRQEKLAKQAYIAQMRSDFEKYVPEKLPGYCTDLPYPGEVTATAESSWEDTYIGNTHWYKWQDTMTVTLHVDKAFDSLSEREIYDMLARFSGCAWSAYDRVREECFPDYN